MEPFSDAIKPLYAWSDPERAKLEEMIKAGKKPTAIVKYWEDEAKVNPAFRARTLGGIKRRITTYRKKRMEEAPNLEKVSSTDTSVGADNIHGDVNSGRSELGDTQDSDRSHHADASSSNPATKSSWEKYPGLPKAPAYQQDALRVHKWIMEISPAPLSHFFLQRLNTKGFLVADTPSEPEQREIPLEEQLT